MQNIPTYTQGRSCYLGCQGAVLKREESRQRWDAGWDSTGCKDGGNGIVLEKVPRLNSQTPK